MTEIVPQELANELVAQAGLGTPRSLEPLAGGRNNRVFRIGLDSGRLVVLKCYHHDPRDPRDRLKAEWNFLNYVGARGVQNVSQPLASDPARQAALYSFVSGERAKTIDAGLVRQAADFAATINGAPHQPERLDPASEACFTLGDHIATVDRRVARLSEIDPDAPHYEQARAFVDARVVSIWQKVRAEITRHAGERGVELSKELERRIVSPSDFGFHNALINRDGSASFLDFEYAGSDDPAKLICDFFCQPELSVPLTYFNGFTGRLAGPLGMQQEDLWRARVLLDAYRIKWVCIMLNEFSSVGARRRAFASVQDSQTRAADQLRSAERYLNHHILRLPSETSNGIP